jgi:hypothetical protein
VLSCKPEVAELQRIDEHIDRTYRIALQIPLAVLVGRFIRLGMSGHEQGASTRKATLAMIWR